MRVIVVGATGHVGSYLVPRLVGSGHEVLAFSRGERAPYVTGDPGAAAAWTHVRRIEVDREAEDKAGSFVGRLVDLRPDVVIDLICFTVNSAEQLLTAPSGDLGLVIHCGTIWIHGPGTTVPVDEDADRTPFGEYGENKLAIERLLLSATRAGKFRATVLHPGHITGVGWAPINPAGNLELDTWQRLADGLPLVLPNLGLETLHHVHADDVAQAFMLALERPGLAGEAFHITSPAALTLRGFANAAAGWFGRHADLTFVSWPEFVAEVGDEAASTTWDHIAHSPSMSIAKAQRELGYSPRYSSLAAIREALRDLADRGLIRTKAEL
jgi:nucleoside-diphosphate-sugar epimerase